MGCNFCWVSGDAVTADYVAKEGYTALEQVALSGAQFQSSLAELYEDSTQLLQLILEGLGVDYHVVQVNQQDFPGHASQYLLHQPFKGSRCIVPYWPYFYIVQSKLLSYVSA